MLISYTRAILASMHRGEGKIERSEKPGRQNSDDATKDGFAGS